jgi:hypothetical protein
MNRLSRDVQDAQDQKGATNTAAGSDAVLILSILFIPAQTLVFVDNLAKKTRILAVIVKNNCSAGLGRST